jgi:hypothetical protein
MARLNLIRTWRLKSTVARADRALVAANTERKAGGWVLEQAQSRLTWLLFAAFVCADLGFMAAWVEHDHVLALLLGAFALVLFIWMRDSVELAIPWLRGGNAEAAVGDELQELRYDGYHVTNDLMFGGRGNIDHLVSGPNGVFLIETKANRYELPQLKKLKWQAARVHDELGGHWVTPVMCAGVRRRKPFRHDGVWIAGRGQLSELIKSLPGKPIDTDRLYRFTDRLD